MAKKGFGWKAVTFGLSRPGKTIPESSLSSLLGEAKSKKKIGNYQVASRGYGAWEGTTEKSVTVLGQFSKGGLEFLRKGLDNQDSLLVQSKKGKYLYERGGKVASAKPEGAKGQYEYVITIRTNDTYTALSMLKRVTSPQGYGLFSGANLRQVDNGVYRIESATFYGGEKYIIAKSVNSALSDMRRRGIHASAKLVRLG